MSITRIILSAVAVSTLSCTAATAQPLPDPAFGVAGYALVDFGLNPASNDNLAALAELPDGRIVTAGTVSTTSPGGVFRPESRVGLARLSAQGSPDPSFGARDGQVVLPAWQALPAGRYVTRAMALQPDGKIVVAGSFFSDTAAGSDFFVLRALANGAGLDTQFSGDGIAYVSFDYGGEQRDAANALLLQPDGKIVVAGSARVTSDQQYAVATRLLPNGQLDLSFSGDGKIAFDFDDYDEDSSWTAEIRALALQSDGKIVLAGSCNSYYQPNPLWQPNQDFVVARLLVDGAIDTGFGRPSLTPGLRRGFDSDGYVFGHSEVANALAISELPGNPAGSRRIVLGGWHETQGERHLVVMGYTDQGVLDENFAFAGRQSIDLPSNGTRLDAEIGAITTQAQLQWTGSHFVYERKIVFAGHVRYDLAAAPRQFVVGRLPYASGYQYPDRLSLFTADLDGDGRPDDAGAQAMALRGPVLIAGGNAAVARRNADFVVTRLLLDP